MMVEEGKKYKLKLIRDFNGNDPRDYLVIKIFEDKSVVCESEDGERFLFMTDFLIDPEKPDEIYSNLIVKRG